MTAKIPLQNGEYAIVDKEDYERCMEHYWYWQDRRGVGQAYVFASIEGEHISLTTFLKGELAKGNVYIHNNGNRLDFRKENLVIKPLAYSVNKSKARKGSTSKYKGVHWNKQRNCWMAYIKVNGKNKYLGKSNSEDEAAELYNKAALEIFGIHAYQNVIGEDNRNNDKKRPIKEPNLRRNTKKKKTSKYRGVFFYKPTKNWRSSINSKYIGTFDTAEQAAKAYDKKAYELYGDKAILNFPELIGEYKREVTNNGS